MIFQDKKVLVCGAGLSGVAAAGLLLRQGSVVTLHDSREDAVCPENLAAHPLVSTFFGKDATEIVENFDIVVLSPGISINQPFAAKARACGIDVIGELELAASLCVAPILAITGTNGKTTTTSMVGDIMRLFVPESQVVGNIGIPFCDFAEAIPKNAFAVAEVSSFQLESIKDFRPRISAVLNMAEDHLNRHLTMETYVAAKERIFENQGPGDFCVLNFDNEYTHQMAAKVKSGTEVIFFSNSPLKSGVFIQDGGIYINWRDYWGEVLKIDEMQVLGSHNVEDAMAAAAISAAAGVPLDIIAKGLREFKGAEHRLEFCGEVVGVSFFNDSKATNPDAAIKGLEAMVRPTILIGGGQDKGLDFSDWVQGFEGRVKSFIIIGEAAEKVAQTCREQGFEHYVYCDTLENAVKLAFERAAAGDCVLLSPACASLDMFDSYEHRGRVFKENVKRILEIRG